jgi:protein TonB
MPARGQDLLVFSATPVVPKGEVAVPKASVQGGFTGSAKPNAQTAVPPGAAELSSAEVVIPSISIVNKTAPAIAASPAAALQAPLPAPPPVTAIPKPSNPARSALLDFLPSRLPSSRPLPTSREIVPTESPLRDYESRGGPVFTAAINAPNFTSKRGSWIFRFAELDGAELSSPVDEEIATLTPPSAVVKVDPKYAPEVVREKLEGVVILFAILRRDGTIDAESVRVVRKLDPRLDQSAREALLNWRFKASQRRGVTVDIQMEVSIPFYFRKHEGL